MTTANPTARAASSPDVRDRASTDAVPTAAPKLVMSTMWGSSPRWRDHVDFYVTDSFGTPGDLRRLWRLARGKKGIVLLGSVTRRHLYRDFVFALLIKVLRRPGERPRILFTDSTWEPESKALAKLTGLPAGWFALPQRLMIRAVDGPHVRYAVLSTAETRTFPELWSVDPGRVVFTPFPATIAADTPVSDGDYLFAGGNSYRDYGVLEEALEGIDVDCRVASTWQPRPGSRIRSGPVPHAEFVSLLAGCRASVVPLQSRVRSAGQQSYLNAMLLGKPVIVTDAPGVRDYIEDGVTGVVVPAGDAAALRAAVRDVLDPARAEFYAQMGRRAREWVLGRATEDVYKDVVLLDAIGIPSGTA